MLKKWKIGLLKYFNVNVSKQNETITFESCDVVYVEQTNITS